MSGIQADKKVVFSRHPLEMEEKMLPKSEPSFRESVDLMFNRAVQLMDLQCHLYCTLWRAIKRRNTNFYWISSGAF